jgi:rfaE bifunctional protein nucleotidyltransferase chain/domain
VVSQSELLLRRSEWKRVGRAVVCASGCFDLLHLGHIRLLEEARSYGVFLVVLVESDAAARERFEAARIRRPIAPCNERMELLAALAAVDFVTEIDTPSPHEFLLKLAPNAFVEGASETAQEFGLHQRELEAAGCRVVYLPMEPGYSTTKLLERIKEIRA